MRDNEVGEAVANHCQREYHVVMAMRSLESTIQHAVELSITIGDRLSLVLMPEVPTEISNKEPVPPLVVKMAQQLLHMEEGVAKIVEQLQSVLDRCEL